MSKPFLFFNLVYRIPPTKANMIALKIATTIMNGRTLTLESVLFKVVSTSLDSPE